MPLTWHYRSQHESLITYSNYRFYAPDGQALQTFPSATFTSPDLGVASYVVNGTYRRGTTRDNPVEADAVVDRVVFHREHHPELSIGVVTFSAAQESAVSAAIERRSVDEPALAGLLDDHDRLNGFFVKNLENVQGDERDIILFSLGYGPDDTGKFTMNFGPVGRQGGWRRLNVAVTRARRRVEVVSSFRAADLKETANESLAHLRAYLDFAERGSVALGEPPHLHDDTLSSDLEDDVMAAISSWGYVVDQRVGSAGYRIDLAVRHPDRPGEYLLAVECDGPSYHSAASARDRDRLRTSVLQRLGWQVYRIWGLSWMRDRAQEAAALRRAIDSALAGMQVGPEPSTPESVPLDVEEVDLEAAPSWAVAYQACTRQAPSTRYALGEVEARPALQSYMTNLLETESPIHRDLVYKRVREAFDVGRVGSNVKANIEFVAERVQVAGQKVRIDQAGFFRAAALAAVRVPEDGDSVRTVAQTPPEELDLAVVSVVRDAVTAEDDAVVTAVSRIFGWRRSGVDIQAALSTAVERCLAAGTLARSANGALRAT